MYKRQRKSGATIAIAHGACPAGTNGAKILSVRYFLSDTNRDPAPKASEHLTPTMAIRNIRNIRNEK